MPYTRAILRELVGSAFANEDLKVFCSDNFSDVYNNFTDDQSKNDRILQLLDFVDTHKGFKQLAGLVQSANPEKYKEFESRLTQEIEQPDKDITDVLVTIQAELRRDPDYDYLLRRFTAILEQISSLSDYKALHDGLHEIQYSYYQNIIRNTKIVMDDKYAKYDLFRYLRDYQRVVSEMQQATGKKKVDPVEDQWVAQLDQAGNDLEEGINKGNKSQIDSATQTMNQVIGTQPTIINRKLYSAVYAYNESLPELTKVMNKVREKFNAIAPQSEMAKFQKGIDSLKELNTKLSALIAEHNTWQDVDTQLRILPDLLDAGVSVFNKRWQSQRARIEPFYTSNENESSVLYKSSVRLKGADDMLGAAIVENDPGGVRIAFENYCSQASERFFYVDKSVMELCGKLSLIHNELD